MESVSEQTHHPPLPLWDAHLGSRVPSEQALQDQSVPFPDGVDTLTHVVLLHHTCLARVHDLRLGRSWRESSRELHTRGWQALPGHSQGRNPPRAQARGRGPGTRIRDLPWVGSLHTSVTAWPYQPWGWQMQSSPGERPSARRGGAGHRCLGVSIRKTRKEAKAHPGGHPLPCYLHEYKCTHTHICIHSCAHHTHICTFIRGRVTKVLGWHVSPFSWEHVLSKSPAGITNPSCPRYFM